MVLIMVSFLFWACAPTAEPIETQCVVNSDQSSLFKGHWSTHPVPLAVELNDFSDSEISAIQASIASWNSFFQASKGFQLYLSGSSSLAVINNSGTRITSATACSQAVINSNGFTNKIKIYKTTSGWSYGSAVMALTSLCPVSTGSSYRSLISAVMEVNYQNYFVAGKPLPDLQSIVTHELGHMLGLDHSCNGAACSNASQDYIDAIMYPSLGFDGINGRIKQEIKKNDQQRANCLY